MVARQAGRQADTAPCRADAPAISHCYYSLLILFIFFAVFGHHCCTHIKLTLTRRVWSRNPKNWPAAQCWVASATAHPTVNVQVSEQHVNKRNDREERENYTSRHKRGDADLVPQMERKKKTIYADEEKSDKRKKDRLYDAKKGKEMTSPGWCHESHRISEWEKENTTQQQQQTTSERKNNDGIFRSWLNAEKMFIKNKRFEPTGAMISPLF